jgi:hypothetical protein
LDWKNDRTETYHRRDQLIAGTRIALGAGLGLLLSSRLNNEQRKAAGWALALVGDLTTIPLALGVIGKKSVEQIR